MHISKIKLVSIRLLCFSQVLTFLYPQSPTHTKTSMGTSEGGYTTYREPIYMKKPQHSQTIVLSQVGPYPVQNVKSQRLAIVLKRTWLLKVEFSIQNQIHFFILNLINLTTITHFKMVEFYTLPLDLFSMLKTPSLLVIGLTKIQLSHQLKLI